MRRPLIGIAVGVGFGTYLALTFGSIATVLPAIICLAALCITLHILHREWLANISLHFLIILLTWFFAAQSEDRSLAKVMSTQHGSESCEAILSGRISSDITDAGKTKGGWGIIKFSIRATSITIDEKQYTVSDTVRVIMHGTPRYPPVYGETWNMKGQIYPLKYGNRVGHQRYGFSTGLRNSKCIKETQLAFFAWGHGVRRRAADMLANGINDYPDVIGVIHAMMLGYRSHLPKDVRDCFRHTGTMHIFAISGLHVGILCSIIVFALAVLGLPRTMWVLALAPLICTYTVVTGARASAIRASAMAIAYLLAPLLRRKADSISAFAFAATIILLWNPSQIFDVGFIYSFAVVAGIIAIVPIFDAIFKRIWQHDEFVPSSMMSKTLWLRMILRSIIRLFSVSLAAWLTSTPLSLYFFGSFSPVALLGNLIAIPLAFLILVTGCLSLLAGSFIGILGEVFNSANWCFVQLLVRGMHLLERIPYGWGDCGNLPLWGVIIWYTCLIAGVIWARLDKKGKS